MEPTAVDASCRNATCWFGSGEHGVARGIRSIPANGFDLTVEDIVAMRRGAMARNESPSSFAN